MIIVMVIILIVTIVPSREQPFDSASGSLFGFTREFGRVWRKIRDITNGQNYHTYTQYKQMY